MYACLAVTWHLHFWQNDRDFLRATVVTRGWNGYRNKSQHRKSTLEKKILPPFQQGFEPATFQSRVRCSNHWAIPAPLCWSNREGSFYIRHVVNKIETSSVYVRFGPYWYKYFCLLHDPTVMLMMKWCLMSSDVSWHIRDKLWPMPKHGSIILYVHGNQKAR